MTVLIGLAGKDAVFLATDTRRTLVANGQALPNVDKMKVLPGPTLWSKGGYGSSADHLFSLVAADARGQSSNVNAVAEATYELGSAVYASCKAEAAAQKMADVGLFVLIAGFDNNGLPTIRTVNFGLDEQKTFGPGERVVMASNTEKARIAIKGLERRHIDANGKLHADAFGRDAIGRITKVLPDHVGFPADLAVARFGLPLIRRRVSGQILIELPGYQIQV